MYIRFLYPYTMKKHNKSTAIFTLVLTSLFFAHQIIASSGYTKAEVAKHNTSSSCWTIYNGGVYDITTYLALHNNNYYNITPWCGTDITSNYNATGHSAKASNLLATFKIGVLTTTPTTTSTPSSTSTTKTDDDAVTVTPVVETTTPTVTDTNTTAVLDVTTSHNPYNLLLPLILGIILYWGSLLIFSKKLKQFNAFWNTLLILTFLIPSFGFGIFMMLQYQFPSLMKIDFRFLYWHVELSVFMGVLAMSHFIRRLKIYLMQLKTR